MSEYNLYADFYSIFYKRRIKIRCMTLLQLGNIDGEILLYNEEEYNKIFLNDSIICNYF